MSEKSEALQPPPDPELDKANKEIREAIFGEAAIKKAAKAEDAKLVKQAAYGGEAMIQASKAQDKEDARIIKDAIFGPVAIAKEAAKENQSPRRPSPTPPKSGK